MGWHTVDGSLKSGKLTSWYGKYSHYLRGFSTIQPVVGNGISEPATVSSTFGLQGPETTVFSPRFFLITPPKINMEHNHGGLEDDFPFQIGDF